MYHLNRIVSTINDMMPSNPSGMLVEVRNVVVGPVPTSALRCPLN